MCEGTRERLRDLRTRVPSFARAAVAQEHRLCGSNKKDDEVSQFWRLHVQEQVVSRVLSKGSRPFLCFSPWVVGACPPPWSSNHLPSRCISVPEIPLFIKTQVLLD